MVDRSQPLRGLPRFPLRTLLALALTVFGVRWLLDRLPRALSVAQLEPANGTRSASLVASISPSLVLGSAALALALILGLTLGYVAWRQNAVRRRRLDEALLLVALVPRFWLGILLVWLFHTHWHWLPASHLADSGSSAGGIEWRHLVLPALTLALPIAAVLTRTVVQSFGTADLLAREQLLQALGLSPLSVYTRGVLAPLRRTVLGLLVLDLPMLLSGAAVVETLFAWPGLGRLTAEAIASSQVDTAGRCIAWSGALALLGAWWVQRDSVARSTR